MPSFFLSIASFIAFILASDTSPSLGVSRQYSGLVAFVAQEPRFKDGAKATTSAVKITLDRKHKLEICFLFPRVMVMQSVFPVSLGEKRLEEYWGEYEK